DDEQPAGLQVLKVYLERGRIHRHEAIQAVAGRVDALAPELELEARDAKEGAGRGADLGGEVRQGRDVIAGPRRLGRELLARGLHAVAGVPGRPDQGPVDLLQRLALGGGGGSTHRAGSP